MDAAARIAVSTANRTLRYTAVAALGPRLPPDLRLRLGERAVALGGPEAVDLLIAVVRGADDTTKNTLLEAARAAAEGIVSDSGEVGMRTSTSLLSTARSDAPSRSRRSAVLGPGRRGSRGARRYAPAELRDLATMVLPVRALQLSAHLTTPARHRLLPVLIVQLDASLQLEVVKEVESADEVTRAGVLSSLLDPSILDHLDGAAASRLRDAARTATDPRAR